MENLKQAVAFLEDAQDVGEVLDADDLDEMEEGQQVHTPLISVPCLAALTDTSQMAHPQTHRSADIFGHLSMHLQTHLTGRC